MSDERKWLIAAWLLYVLAWFDAVFMNHESRAACVIGFACFSLLMANRERKVTP